MLQVLVNFTVPQLQSKPSCSQEGIQRQHYMCNMLYQQTETKQCLLQCALREGLFAKTNTALLVMESLAAHARAKVIIRAATNNHFTFQLM